MEQYISKSALVEWIEKERKEYAAAFSNMNFKTYEARLISKGKYRMLQDILSFINTLEVKEMPETTHTECKKIKKLCEIQRYDENSKAYSVMLPDTRLFMDKINDIIDTIIDIDSRLLMLEQRKRE